MVNGREADKFNCKKKILVYPKLESTALGDREWFMTKSIQGEAGKVPSGMIKMKASF